MSGTDNFSYSVLQPPLVQACFHGDPDEVRALLYKKEDVNYQVQCNTNTSGKDFNVGDIDQLSACAVNVL